MIYLVKAYKLLTLFAVIAFMCSVIALDSESWVPTYVLIGSTIWLAGYVALDNWLGLS